jgi:hypothetical protein
MRMNYTILVLALALFSSSMLAQRLYTELITDRPDKTESAVVVPSNVFQIESGFIFQKQKYSENNFDIENENLLIGSTLFRYGVSELIEMRFGAEYFSGKSNKEGNESLFSGVQGIFIGSKIQLRKDKELLTDAAIIINLNLPFGNEKLRPARFEPGITLSASQYLGKKISLGINLGLQDNSFRGGYEYFYSTAFGFKITEKFNVFLELYGDINKAKLPNHFFDLGFTYLQMHNLQIDFSGGTILSENKIDWFGSIGFSVRLPE